MRAVSLNKRLTVVIPTYNEAENLEKLICVLFSLPLPNLSVLVVDDNSPDGTGRIADELQEKYPQRISVCHRAGKLGLGTAYLEGFKQALDQGADAVGQMDCDFSHPPEKLVELLEALGDHDIALGSRYIPGGGLDECWPLWRKALSSWGNFYARSILGLLVRDVTGGFRVWRREVLVTMPLARVQSNGYAFQVEMIYLASKLGFTSIEVPIYFADRCWGKSKMSFRIQVEAAVRVWQMLQAYRDVKSVNGLPI